MTAPLLTLVTDRRRARMTLPELARRAIDGGVDMVQVREKDLGPVQLHALVTDIVDTVGPAHVAVNDAPAIATSLGLHLHLSERAAADFPGRADGGTVSCSVHSVGSLATVPADAAFVIAGHLFPTGTHPHAKPLGHGGLRAIVETSIRPVVAIGGISPANVEVALSAGVAGVAVISYVNCNDRPKLAARELRDALERAMSQLTSVVSVQVNGKAMSVEPNTTLTSFLEFRNLHPRLVVVERNREIVAKSAYDSTILEEGDLLEIAHFVGGG